MKNIHKIFGTFLITVSIAGFAPVAGASHSWADYHWARTTNSFDLTVVNSTTSEWDGYVTQAVADWSTSSNVNMIEEAGSTAKKVRKQCKGGSGSLRICNDTYGNTGWVGIAGISLDTQGHITTGYTKMNDTYYADPFYDTPAWRLSVTCQELGHNLGLGHQDEDFNNQSLFSCMDYQNPPYEYPNGHDYDQLDTIYGHTDSYDSYGSGGTSGGCNAPPGKGCNKPGSNGSTGWGMSLGRSGNAETFMRIDPDGTRHLVHVTWAIGF